MTTNELIELLKKEDPTGEHEVCVGNHDIYYVDTLPAYWDGCLQRLIIDESKKPYYSVVGAKVTSKGQKVNIHTMGVEDVLLEDSEAPVDLSELHPTAHKDWTERVERYRRETREINEEIKREFEIMKNKDAQGKYHSVNKEFYKKLRKVRFFRHVERIQRARHNRWSRKLPHNRTKKKLATSSYLRVGKLYGTAWEHVPWEEPKLCPINLDALEQEYLNAKVGYDKLKDVPDVKLSQESVDTMLKILYDWTDNVYGK